MKTNQETFKLIRELKKKKISFFQNFNLSRKIEILNRISEIGTAADINDLVPLTLHKNKELREKAVETIEISLKRTTTKSNIYASLRYCDIHPGNLNTYQQIYSEKYLMPLLIIASMNKSGFVRESAVKAFKEYPNPRLIRYLLFRLGDWIKEIRKTASVILDDFLKEELLEAFIEQLSTVEWLLKVNRTNLQVEHQKIIDFLTVKHLDRLLQVFSKQKEQNRLVLAKYLLKAENVELSTIQVLIKDKNFLVRNLIAKNLEKLYSDDLKNTLLNDKHNKVRLNTLYILLKIKKIKDKEWETFLTDKSFSVRDLARFELRNANIYFTAFYKSHIEEGKHLRFGILSLGEIEGNKEVEYLRKYLDHKNGLFRQSAAIAIIKMEEYAIDDYLVEKLGSDDEMLKKIAVNHLSKQPDNETLDKIRAIYEKANPKNKITILKLFSRIKTGKKRVHQDLLVGEEDENKEVREIAGKYLSYWNRKSHSPYSN